MASVLWVTPSSAKANLPIHQSNEQQTSCSPCARLALPNVSASEFRPESPAATLYFATTAFTQALSFFAVVAYLLFRLKLQVCYSTLSRFFYYIVFRWRQTRPCIFISTAHTHHLIKSMGFWGFGVLGFWGFGV